MLSIAAQVINHLQQILVATLLSTVLALVAWRRRSLYLTHIGNLRASKAMLSVLRKTIIPHQKDNLESYIAAIYTLILVVGPTAWFILLSYLTPISSYGNGIPVNIEQLNQAVYNQGISPQAANTTEFLRSRFWNSITRGLDQSNTTFVEVSNNQTMSPCLARNVTNSLLSGPAIVCYNTTFIQNSADPDMYSLQQKIFTNFSATSQPLVCGEDNWCSGIITVSDQRARSALQNIPAILNDNGFGAVYNLYAGSSRYLLGSASLMNQIDTTNEDAVMVERFDQLLTSSNGAAVLYRTVATQITSSYSYNNMTNYIDPFMMKLMPNQYTQFLQANNATYDTLFNVMWASRVNTDSIEDVYVFASGYNTTLNLTIPKYIPTVLHIRTKAICNQIAPIETGSLRLNTFIGGPIFQEISYDDDSNVFVTDQSLIIQWGNSSIDAMWNSAYDGLIDDAVNESLTWPWGRSVLWANSRVYSVKPTILVIVLWVIVPILTFAIFLTAVLLTPKLFQNDLTNIIHDTGTPGGNKASSVRIYLARPVGHKRIATCMNGSEAILTPTDEDMVPLLSVKDFQSK
ncbi:hypothetical protein BGW37DRAFT_490795 [Umbelopsis sp. PMI_123]|nr:hypothetical protein BGW37DRAFT_490795 [Umbelopsis sp. PMI_123]